MPPAFHYRTSKDNGFPLKNCFILNLRDCVGYTRLTSPSKTVREIFSLFGLEEPVAGRGGERISEVLERLKGSRKETELECRLPVEGTDVILSGRIDLYAEFDDHVEIHDWKTDATDCLLEEYRVQLSIYAYAAEKVIGKEARCFIEYLSNGIGTVEVEKVSMDEIRRRVLIILDENASDRCGLT